MKEIYGDIMDVKSGVIVHQVNCQNRIGAGLSGAIISRYPIVEKLYHELCETLPPKQLLGEVQKIQAAPGLVIVNLFGQLYYGNAEKTHRVYTDPNALTEGIQRVLDETNETVFIPGFIGCGLAGYDWTKLKPVLKRLRGSERLTAIYKARIQKGFGAATPPRWDI